MQFSKKDLNDVLGLLGQAEAFKPLVKVAVEVIRSYAGELKEIAEAFRQWTVESRIASFKQYRAADFSREEALLLVMDPHTSLKRLLSYIPERKDR